LAKKSIYGEKSIFVPEVQIDSADILDDVVRGEYTMMDVSLAGAEGEESPIQVLHEVIESAAKNMQTSLNSPKSGNFFNLVDSDLLKRGSPVPIVDIVRQSVLGMEMLQNDPMATNDATSAVNSFIKATAMHEAETKIREAVKSAEDEKKKIEQEKTDESMAESAAVAGVFSEPKDPKNLGFNITEEDFDISFSPSDDPDCYKPLEIISYMGMTN
jgi:hypothetical protein